MGGKSSSSSDSGPWAGTQPYLKDVYSKAQGLYNQGTPGYYPGQTYNDFNPIQQNAMDATLSRANGSPTEQAYGGMLGGMMTQSPVNMGGAQTTAERAMGGFGAGQDTAAHHMQGTSLDTARNLADQGSHGWQNTLAGMSQYRGSPTTSTGPANATNALNVNANSMSLGDAQGYSGSGGGLDVTAKSRLKTLSEGNNPYLNDMAKAATDSVREQFSESVMPSLNATFSMGGRTGSRAHTDATGKAAEGLADTIANTTASIYGTNYQSDMDRRLNAATSLGDLEVGEFNANSGDDIARKGLGADLYLGSKGISNQAAGTLMDDNATRVGMGQDYDINRRGLAQDATSTGYGFQLDKNSQMNDWYNQGANRAMQGAGMLMDGGMGAIDDMTQMYGVQSGAMLGAGSQVGNLSDLEWGNIDRQMNVGDRVQGLSDEMLRDDMDRFSYYQNAPMDMLNWYAGIIGDNAAMSTRNKGSGWNLSSGLLGFL